MIQGTSEKASFFFKGVGKSITTVSTGQTTTSQPEPCWRGAWSHGAEATQGLGGTTPTGQSLGREGETHSKKRKKEERKQEKEKKNRVIYINLDPSSPCPHSLNSKLVILRFLI